jgi:PAS domain S-box-containing protein
MIPAAVHDRIASRGDRRYSGRPMAIISVPGSSERELLGLLVDKMRDYAILLLDVDGRVVTWNEGARRLKGYEEHEIVGRHFSTFYTPEDIARGHPTELLRTAVQQGTVEDRGWRVRKGGTRFWADVMITAVRDEAGNLRGFGKVVRDLTDRRAAEEALRVSEERLRLLVESVREYAIIMLDPGGLVVSWNNGAERIKGYRAEEVIGRDAQIFYPEETRDRFPGLLEEAKQRGCVEEEGWRVRKDGSRFWADVVLTSIKDDTGKLVGFAKITRDLTERRAAEQNALRLAQAEEAVRMRDEFLSIASHELKTPLTSLQLHLLTLSRLVEKSPGAPMNKLDVAGRLDKAQKQIRRLTALIETLLDVSRIATGRLRLQIAPMDLAELVKEIFEDMRAAAERAGCSLSLHVAPGVITKGEWDETRLAQVFTNLLDNALKYGRGKPVEVEVTSDDGGVRVCVVDHGIGIPHEDLVRVFGRFERAVSARHFGGLGLGLYVSREVVEAHGGRLRAESEPGVATRFTFELPRQAPRSSSTPGAT